MHQPKHFQRTVILTMVLILGIVIILSIPRKPQLPREKKEVAYQFCSRFPSVKIDKGREPALALNYDLQWRRPMTLNVFFFGLNPPRLIERVISIANEWSKYCGMRFKAVDAMSDSHIRLTFKTGGYSSAVGIEAVQERYKRSYTMCLQGLDTLSDETEFRRVVLHEFGHAIGLEHELQSPAAEIPWDTAALYAFYLDRHRWQPDSVMKHVLMKLENVEYTGFDSTSIMVYAVPDILTKGDYEIRWPKDLSATDRSTIGEWYPK